ncbi:carbohydrate ABC transporter permease [Saccharopolyspora sp. NPDC002686]|uniref:carbohydrate ABC transporter permease n=1 Tax=Saccharopolyspora sp. NPDC002686 TaxID=3154541 RepID=UPI003332C1EB
MTATSSTQAIMSVPRPGSQKPRSRRKGGWRLTALLAVLSLSVLIPLYLTIAMALKTPEQAATGSGLEWPAPIQWDNFAVAWKTVNFGQAMISTAVITAIAVAGGIVASALLAYAVVRNWDRLLFKTLYVYILAGLFIPIPVVILPLVKQTAILGLDNPFGVALLYIVSDLAFNSLLFIAFIRSIPLELEESARIDGASTWRVFWNIVFPLLGPMIATVGIFTFLGAWNGYLIPRMIIADPHLQTLPVVQFLFQGEFNVNYNLAFASYLMALAPTLIAYVIAQRWVLSGVMRGAIK